MRRSQRSHLPFHEKATEHQHIHLRAEEAGERFFGAVHLNTILRRDRQTSGSFSLKEVLSTKETDVREQKAAVTQRAAASGAGLSNQLVASEDISYETSDHCFRPKEEAADKSHLISPFLSIQYSGRRWA